MDSPLLHFLFNRALALALDYKGLTSPNPIVGALIVDLETGEILAEGAHKGAGHPHAEVVAWQSYIEKEKQAASLSFTSNENSNSNPNIKKKMSLGLICTLEPCCHKGGEKRTPPCTDFIINTTQIGKVFVGSLDPNPLVAGKGIESLKKAGIDVIVADVDIQKKCQEINRAFWVSMQQKRTYLTLKWAQGLDGKLVAADGKSQWISGELSRTRVKKLRFFHDAIGVGAQTFINDSPQLNYSLPSYLSPKDSSFNSFNSFNSNNFNSLKSWKKIVFTHQQKQKIEKILCKREDKESWLIIDSSLPLNFTLEFLWEEYKIQSLFIEGGPRLLSHFFASPELIDEIHCFIAPKIIGSGEGIFFKNAFAFKDHLSFQKGSFRSLGEDIVFKWKRPL